MDAGLFDMLHDSGDHNVFAVAERIYVHLDRVFEEVIDEDGAIVRVLHCLGHVMRDGCGIVCDDHGAPAEYVRGTNQHGKADAFGSGQGLFHAGSHDAGRLWNVELTQQLAEALAIFSEID